MHLLRSLAPYGRTNRQGSACRLADLLATHAPVCLSHLGSTVCRTGNNRLAAPSAARAPGGRSLAGGAVRLGTWIFPLTCSCKREQQWMSYYQIYLHELSRLLSVDSQVDQIHYPKIYEGPSEQRRVNCQFDTEYPELHGARLIGIEVGGRFSTETACARAGWVQRWSSLWLRCVHTRLPCLSFRLLGRLALWVRRPNCRSPGGRAWQPPVDVQPLASTNANLTRGVRPA